MLGLLTFVMLFAANGSARLAFVIYLNVPFAVTGGLFAKLGANIEGVSQGKNADMNSPTRKYNDEERAELGASEKHRHLLEELPAGA